MSDLLRVVAAIFIGDDNKIFLAQRQNQGNHANLWEFPGGKIEDGESEVKALKREIDEELGVSIEIGERFGEFIQASGQVRIRLIAYFATINSGQTIHFLEHSDMGWFDAKLAKELKMAPLDREIFVKLNKS